jgi:hypothetical protein
MHAPIGIPAGFVKRGEEAPFGIGFHDSAAFLRFMAGMALKPILPQILF